MNYEETAEISVTWFHEILRQHIESWKPRVDLKLYPLKENSGGEKPMDNITEETSSSTSLKRPPLQPKRNDGGLSGMNRKKDKFQSWQMYFNNSEWEQVFLCVDVRLKTGTILLYSFRENMGVDRLSVAIARDISWTLFRIMENNHLGMYTLSYIIVNDLRGMDQHDLTHEIIVDI